MSNDHGKRPGASPNQRAALESRAAASGLHSNDDLLARLDRIPSIRVDRGARITRPTALLVDKSGSIGSDLEISKRVAMRISKEAARLLVLAFDTDSYPLRSAGEEPTDWEAAFRGIEAAGDTSIGAPLEAMRRKRQSVEQIVVVTDERENTAPFFADAYDEYRRDMGGAPSVVIVRVGRASDDLEQQLRASGVEVTALTPFTPDDAAGSLRSLIRMLGRPSWLDRLIDTLDPAIGQSG